MPTQLKLECPKVIPMSGCTHVMIADSEEKLMEQVAEHAGVHGLTPTPDLVETVRKHIEYVQVDA
ncbi:DUF1059 domain-containing protein [Streptomyces sp. WAC06614]|uniref:DUF1059 domain-containing protein n=1 Tax=Streptomyces sp. WAC06614 TaxID=2487416 RepID=UPI000F77FDCB|nr:DUF1059 domain-containing protein [Streptomyces sp. WAC06614]RSS83580.1 DUF1059 domain-containing protein [Streptomyces sp. WAC06614]